MALRNIAPAWWTAVATGAGYLVLLLVMFVALFVVPYVVFVRL